MNRSQAYFLFIATQLLSGQLVFSRPLWQTILEKVFKRYNIVPSKATRLEYDFVTRVAESEFYQQQANA